MPTSNVLYVAVLPLMRLPPLTYGPRTRLPGVNVVSSYGATVEQFMTLFPDKEFASEFFADEIDFYVDAVRWYLKPITGGHVIRYEVSTEETPDGRFIVKVVQHVA
jgi:hypothetical protein